MKFDSSSPISKKEEEINRKKGILNDHRARICKWRQNKRQKEFVDTKRIEERNFIVMEYASV